MFVPALEVDADQELAETESSGVTAWPTCNAAAVSS
jgi:hypothetical protein